MMGPHKNLEVWKIAMNMITLLYKCTSDFPQHELFGLVSQMRRAAVSITSNIAEGYGRSTNNELIHFLHFSLGSSNEIDTQLQVARNLNYLTEENFNKLDEMNENVNKMLRSLIYKRSHTQSTEGNPMTTKP